MSAANARAVAHVELLRKLKVPVRKRARKRLPKPPSLIPQELALLTLANGPIKALRERLAPLLLTLPELLRVEAEARKTDAYAYGDFLKKLEQIAKSVETDFGTDRLRALGAKVGADIAAKSRRAFVDQMTSAIGVALPVDEKGIASLLENHTADVVSKIRGLAAKATEEIAAEVRTAVLEGKRHEELAAEIAGRFEVSASRAAFIARNETGTLYGQITATRQKSAGVLRFIWRTSHDERVRPEHEALDGQIFEYADPPSIGVPGEDFNCRCYAEPVLDDILDP